MNRLDRFFWTALRHVWPREVGKHPRARKSVTIYLTQATS
jgi:hypothetical protein